MRAALEYLRHPTYVGAVSQITLPHLSISVHDVALAFEIGLGPVKHPVRVPAGIGATWFGVETEQSVTDSATLHEIMWRVRPRLVIEIGTMCGGSACFFAKTMMGYDPTARVVTIDRKHPSERGIKCVRKTQCYGSPLWSELQASGNLRPIWSDVSNASVLSELRSEAARAAPGAVMVVDDASHSALPTIEHFWALEGLVTPGSYYLVEDTRLDADCAASILTMPPGSVYWYCRRLQVEGGPARAVANLTATPTFRSAWRQDRSVEKWAITQHPGGYLRRKGRPRA